nr:MAG TPA: hypothetical protein [Caudoviricetes sp.]
MRMTMCKRCILTGMNNQKSSESQCLCGFEVC